jgi:hypothetical protein
VLDPQNDSYYFDKLRDGYRLVAEFRSLLASAEKAPMYYARGYDSEGEPYGIHENLEPWDAAEEAAQDIAKHPEARRILRAHKITMKLLSPEGGVSIQNKEGDPVRSGDIPVFVNVRNR